MTIDTTMTATATATVFYNTSVFHRAQVRMWVGVCQAVLGLTANPILLMGSAKMLRGDALLRLAAHFMLLRL